VSQAALGLLLSLVAGVPLGLLLGATAFVAETSSRSSSVSTASRASLCAAFHPVVRHRWLPKVVMAFLARRLRRHPQHLRGLRGVDRERST